VLSRTGGNADRPGAGAGVLDGVRVLDFTNMLSGPYCTRLLADMGAEVIKVEPPAGDHNRHRRPVRDGHSSFFGHLNAGKKSVVLNLKSDAGRKAALDIARISHVVVENWRPGVAARLGVGHGDITAFNPAIVYCSISGFGQSGPEAQRPAYAPIVHAASGFDLAQVSYQGVDKPAKSANFIADILGGMSAFAAIQGALFRSVRTGAGQYIDVSLMDCMLNLLVNECQEAQAPSKAKLRAYHPLRTTDGYVVVAPTSQKNFEKLAHTVGHDEWIADPRFAKTFVREQNWAELMDLIEQWTSLRSATDAEATFMRAGVPCSRYRTVDEALADAVRQNRGALAQVTDPAGTYWVPNPPFRMPGLAASVHAHVPALGEHGDEVLSGLLKYTAQQQAECVG
jgi:crotonobetainyl-CoA:carnitine CoA-transferase CaiB-like acyl-CoA transferase